MADPITTVPPQPYQPWDAQTDETVAGWASVESGPADGTGHAAGDFEDGPIWRQV